MVHFKITRTGRYQYAFRFTQKHNVRMADVLATQSHRSVYMITYSQADLTMFPGRQEFSEAVVEAFSATTADIIQWVCCQEQHVNGGKHYHMAIKMSKSMRWLPIRRYLLDNHGINVHFSNRHVNYYSAWTYVTKEDETPLESANHPNLANPPRTMAASQAIMDRNAPGPRPRKRRRAQLSNFEFAEIIRANKLKSRLQVLAFAERLRADGKTDVAEYIFNKRAKVVEEVITTAWEMESAQDDLERSRMARLAILEQCLEEPCVAGCAGKWREQAQDVLHRNDIPTDNFAKAIYDLLKNGRSKYRNVILTGPTNCGKSFLLSPLSLIYKAFTNPASTSFAWVGVESAEIILLNDFRWSSQVKQL